MQNLKALNSKEKKVIYKQLKEQFGHDTKIDAIMLISPKGKIYLLSNDYANLDITNLRINNKAMYFAKQEKDGLRMSIEGSQYITATKNVYEVNKQEAFDWMQGKDIPREGENSYALIKYKNDILGCGMLRDNNIRNMIAKERRLHSVKE